MSKRWAADEACAHTRARVPSAAAPLCLSAALTSSSQCPVLETSDGTLFESNAIARYVARLAPSSLLGASPIEAGQVDMWIDWSTNEVDGPLSSWIYPLFGWFPYDKKVSADRGGGASPLLTRPASACRRRTLPRR